MTMHQALFFLTSQIVRLTSAMLRSEHCPVKGETDRAKLGCDALISAYMSFFASCGATPQQIAQMLRQQADRVESGQTLELAVILVRASHQKGGQA